MRPVAKSWRPVARWFCSRFRFCEKTTGRQCPATGRFSTDSKSSFLRQNNLVSLGDDVKEKKPDPSIYLTASKKLGIPEKDCLVVEDSVIGLQAATKAGMSCVITYTSSTADQDFKDAIATYPDLSNIRLKDLELLLQNAVIAN